MAETSVANRSPAHEAGFLEEIARETGIRPGFAENILSLFDEGATVPFVARYRKERTGGATDEQLRKFQEVYDRAARLLDRKLEVLRLIGERGHLTDEIRRGIEKAATLNEAEDLYRPYKEKRNTRAAAAIALGLAPLADLLQKAELSDDEFRSEAGRFVVGDVADLDAAVQGACDIVAERYSDTPREREIVRNLLWRKGTIRSRKAKGFDPKGPYSRYADHAERLAGIPSHRYLAIMRAAAEKQLTVTLELEPVLNGIRQDWLPARAGSSSRILVAALEDGLKRLLLPSVRREVHAELKRRSDEQAITVFGRNLAQLLMTPPVVGMRILGADPAYRTGCKLAVVDENGGFLESAVVYPTPPQSDYAGAKDTVLRLVKKHRVEGVAIGNGTGSRETQEFFARLNREESVALKFTVVSEAGASVYSASEVGQSEYPQLDVTIRGAISIAHRLQNPMAELVKIDPQSLGIGQYQHDVDQALLGKKLSEITEDLVNRVGVDANSASASLLVHVAGLGPALAGRIVAHRRKAGPFTRKLDLLQVRGIGEAAFQQCSGFLRIRDGQSVLDNTGVHPESYDIASRILAEHSVEDLAGNDVSAVMATLGQVSVGVETIRDIIQELRKPGFDPREELPQIPFREGITEISMLHPGSIVSGVVRSIVDFGAFVDIGLKNDGLIHISQISDRRIAHPMEALSVNQYLPSIRVLKVDAERQKIDLSLKEL